MTSSIYALPPATGDAMDFAIPATSGGLDGAWASVDGLRGINVQIRFLYGGAGSGGVRAVLQTSLDQGSSVYDLAVAEFATTSGRVVFSLVPTTSQAVVRPGQDGVSGDSPVVSEGVLCSVVGDRVKLKVYVDGTGYLNSTISARVLAGEP